MDADSSIFFVCLFLKLLTTYKSAASRFNLFDSFYARRQFDLVFLTNRKSENRAVHRYRICNTSPELNESTKSNCLCCLDQTILTASRHVFLTILGLKFLFSVSALSTQNITQSFARIISTKFKLIPFAW